MYNVYVLGVSILLLGFGTAPSVWCFFYSL